MTAPAELRENDAAVAGGRDLLDRQEERAAVDAVLARARTGAGGAVVLRGEPGIGRSALLEYAAAAAPGMRVCHLAGIDSEVGLGFAGLHRLLTPVAPDLDHLPGPRLAALRAAFGLVAADPPDRFLVGLAALALLAGAAAERPLLVTVDDAQWLDQATVEVLAFVAHRLETVPIAFVIAVRDPTNRCRPLDGLPTVHLRGLPSPAAHELLSAVAGGPLDPRAARRVVAETGGNPLALVAFGRQLGDGHWAAKLPAPYPLPIGARLKSQFLRWVRTLPSGTQTWLLLAASEPSGSPELLRRAAERLGLGPSVARPAEVAGLLTGGDRVTFASPLVRSAVYHGAPPRQRRRAHAALAAALDPAADPDARAWHRAAAAGDADEAVAHDLDAAATRARTNNDHAAEAALLARAAELTPSRSRRAVRLLDAAGAELAAGAPARAEALLDQADAVALWSPDRARSAQLRATVSLARGRFGPASAALLRAAQELYPTEPERARRTLHDAMYAGLVAGVRNSADTLLEVVRTHRSWPAATPTTAGLLLDAFATRLAAGHRAAVPGLRAAVWALVAEQRPDESPYLLAMGCWAAGDLLDGEAQQILVSRWERVTGDGLLGLLVPDPAGLRGTGELLMLAWQGHEAQARAAIADGIRSSAETGAGLGLPAAHYALAVLELGLGHYDAALAAALAVYSDDPPGLGTYVLPDLVEAAVRGGNDSAARSAADRLAERVADGESPLAAGLLARCRALLAAGDEAEDRYGEAIERLAAAGDPAQLARAHLLYGEWLRRRRRRRDARPQLRTARDLFAAHGFEAFAQRSAGELLATGERAGKRTGEAGEQLTPQEMQVARLVVEGSSNRQVAEQLFISPNTVEYHLQKVFRKVGVSSRTQLARALLGEPARLSSDAAA